MSDVSYKPLIENMVWSYSRIDTFDSCPYKWFLRYIKDLEEKEMFFSSYGTFMHKIIEKYYKGELQKNELPSYFLENFKSEVKGERPKNQTVEKYINDGLKYVRNFSPFPFEPVAVEKNVKFKINDHTFVGIIDFIGTKDGEFCIVDNKSRALKQRSGKKKPTVNDKEIDSMLKQLYLYSEAVKQEYGKYPKKLCFNCFRNGVFIEEDFQLSKLEKAVLWAEETIKNIEDTEEFYASDNCWFCRYLCGLNDLCERRA